MVVSITAPFQQIPDLDGSPIDGGFVYIGTANTNPVTASNRLSLFSDAAMTVGLTNPFRTRGGFPINDVGALCNVYCATDFAMAVHDANNLPRYSLASYGFRVFSDAITFNTLIVTASILPDAAGGAFNGSIALPWSNTVSRTTQARTLSLYGTTQPATAADYAKHDQLMVCLLACRGTGGAGSTLVNFKNTASIVRNAAGSYTVTPTVALPAVGLCIYLPAMQQVADTETIITPGTTTFGVATLVGGVATDSLWGVAVFGNPAVADPIS